MCPSKHNATAFTLIELLVVIAIIAVLVSMLAPSIGAAKRMAKIAKARSELRSIGTALQVYESDLEDYPPVRASCNPDMRGHEYQLPVELADEGYLPGGYDLQRMVDVEDPFNPDHTYKYNAPGPLINNNTLQEKGNYLWVPDDFPFREAEGDLLDVDDGRLYNDPEDSPVGWVLWSVGPGGPESQKAASPRAPLSSRTWYSRSDGQGVICVVLGVDGLFLTRP